MTEKTRSQNKVFGYLFFIWFQMFGAVVCGFTKNYLMVTWCTGWATYAVVKLEKLAKQKQKENQ